MEENYQIRYVEHPDDAIWNAVGGGINDYNNQKAGRSSEQRLCIVLHAPDQEIVAGVIGETYWEWFYLSLMWVKEELRGRGYGQHLLRLAEEEARRRGVKHVYLDTFSFQAPEFYKKQGYVVFGELPDFPPGHQRYFMMKQL